MNIEEERRRADERLQLYRSRYAGADESFYPIAVAIEWRNAVSAEPPNREAMRLVADRALPRRNDFDIAFFTFCNQMQIVLNEG